MIDANLGVHFIWWVGVVENRNDPKQVGRCQVRIAGSHTDQKSVLPTDSLPWAQPLIPLNDTSSLQIKEGDYVVGFYMDGVNAQVPIIVGILPGIPVQLLNPAVGFSDPRSGSSLSGAPRTPKTLTISSGGDGVSITENNPTRYPNRLHEPTFSRLSRNEKISQTAIKFKKDSVFKSIPIAGGGTYSEPETPYAAKYPYNRVMETESGHILEFDDTPGSERIHIYHRSGTFDEYHPDGTKVTRIHADAYEIVLSDKHVFINGDIHITAKNDVNIKAGKSIRLEAGEDVLIKAGAQFSSQATVSQSHFTTGPMSLNGIPMNLNGPPTAPLGLPSLPITPIAATTFTAASVVIPTTDVPGNQELAERPGANVGPDKPNVLVTPVETPTDIPAPANTVPPQVQAVTTSEGADLMVRALNRAKITDPTQRAAIYAQAQHESNGFKDLVESMKYTREGLLSVWKKYFTNSNVDQYVRQDTKIASRIYGNRMGNSTEESQDGWTYRGRGFIQLTGKSNYLAVSRSFNQDFVTYPDAAAVPETSADIAVWYFTKGPTGRGYLGSYSDTTSVTKYVNGGTNGLTSRQELFTAAKSNPTVTTFNTALV